MLEGLKAPKDTLKDLSKVAKSVGDLLLKYYAKPEIKTSTKKDLTPITDTDLESQKFIIREPNKHFPEIPIVSEEQTQRMNESSTREKHFIVDPLDGTANFAMHVPIFAIPIALLEKDEPVVTVVYDPIHRECFGAIRGHGAFLNGERMRTLSGITLSETVVDISATKSNKDAAEAGRRIGLASRRIRCLGCTALAACWVASGRIAARVGHSLSMWDVAGTKLPVDEAGGKGFKATIGQETTT